jgi:hypothetical protein
MRPPEISFAGHAGLYDEDHPVNGREQQKVIRNREQWRRIHEDSVVLGFGCLEQFSCSSRREQGTYVLSDNLTGNDCDPRGKGVADVLKGGGPAQEIHEARRYREFQQAVKDWLSEICLYHQDAAAKLLEHMGKV